MTTVDIVPGQQRVQIVWQTPAEFDLDGQKMNFSYRLEISLANSDEFVFLDAKTPFELLTKPVPS